MYRRPKFLEELLEIREQMSRDAFYDADLFAEQVRSGNFTAKQSRSKISPGAKAKEKEKKKSRKS